MKLLDRYVLKELLVPLVIGTVLFALLFVGNETIRIYKDFNVDSIPFVAIVQLLLFHFPNWLSLTLPIGTALGASLAVSRLARESEITAMRAAGVSVARIIRPILFAGLIMGIANYLVVEKAVPPATKAYRKLANDIGFLGMLPQFRSNMFMSINQYSARFGSVQRGKDGLVILRDITLIEAPRPNEKSMIFAPSGTFHDGIWRIDQARTVNIKLGKDDVKVLGTTTKDVLVINNPIRIADLFMTEQPTELSSSELLAAIRANRQAGQSTVSNEVAYHQKYAAPAACLVFAFAGAVLAVRFAKAGPFIGVMVSLGLVWLHFNAYVISGEVLGKNGWLPPVAAAWLPNVLFFALGLIFVRRLE